jgi:ankyrin repeat protein
MKKKSSQRGSLRLTSDKAERLRAFREGPDDDGRRPRPEPAHVVLARAQAAEAERLRRARAPKAEASSRALTVKDEPAKEAPSQALVAIDNEAKAKREAERKEERRKKKERELFAPDAKGETALHRAVLVGDATELRRLLGLPSCRVDCPNFYGDSAIHAAAQLGHIESLTILRDANAKTDRRNRHGLTPLCLAASKGHSQAVVIVAHNLSKKAINAYCGGYTALHWCCVTGIDAACGFLAKKGADASLRAEPDGETCLYKACTYSHTPCVDILLDAGADANAANSDGATALLACAASGDYASLDLLIARGGDVHKADVAGRTPLGVAAQKGNLSCVSRLAAAGALSSSAAPAGDTLVDRFLYKLSFPFAKKDGTEEDVAPGGCTG